MRKNILSTVAVAIVVTAASSAVAGPGNLTIVDAAGSLHAVKEFRGKWVLVNYWATWCAACIEEMPELSTLSSQEPELIVLGATDEEITPEQLRSFVNRHQVSYVLGRSDKAKIPHELSPSVLGVKVRPLSYLVAPDGSVAKRFVGAVDVGKLKLLIADRRR
jgi:thiol-disulfide isomerase/thioredoxin